MKMRKKIKLGMLALAAAFAFVVVGCATGGSQTAAREDPPRTSLTGTRWEMEFYSFKFALEFEESTFVEYNGQNPVRNGNYTYTGNVITFSVKDGNTDGMSPTATVKGTKITWGDFEYTLAAGKPASAPAPKKPEVAALPVGEAMGMSLSQLKARLSPLEVKPSSDGKGYIVSNYPSGIRLSYFMIDDAKGLYIWQWIANYTESNLKFFIDTYTESYGEPNNKDGVYTWYLPSTIVAGVMVQAVKGETSYISIKWLGTNLP